MATLPVYDKTGAKVGQYEIDYKDIAPRINKQLLHDVVVMYQASQRMGTASTRSRGEVSGSTRKLYRQKGTGNARAGSRKSGIRRGGGHIHALKTRDYSYRLPKKVVRAATRMAVAGKIRDGQLVVIDELKFGQPKTKEFVEVLKALKLDGVTTLVTTSAYDPIVFKSARNVPGVSVSPVSDLCALSVLTPRKLLVTKAALDVLKERSAAGKSE